MERYAGAPRTLLADNPNQFSMYGLIKSAGTYGIGSGLLAAFGMKVTFQVSSLTGKLPILQRFPSNNSSLAVGGVISIFGMMYGMNRQVLMLAQPGFPAVPRIIQKSVDSPVYQNDHYKNDIEVSPRTVTAYKTITNNIIQQELGLSKEKPTGNISQFELENELAKINAKFQLQNNLNLRNEMLAACIIGWILTPLIGGMFINTGIAMTVGGLSFIGREYFRELSDYKLYRWLFIQKVQLLVENNVINPEEKEELLTIMQKEPNTIIGPIRQGFYKTVYVLSRAFPVLTKATEEELYQRKYLGQLELEYDDWREAQRLPPAGHFYS